MFHFNFGWLTLYSLSATPGLLTYVD